MACSLIFMLRAGADRDYIHTPSLPRPRHGDHHKIAQTAWFWGLVAEEPGRRPDGGRRGFRRLTERGIAFARNELDVPKYAHVYDGRVLDNDGEYVSILDCLGKRFDYGELMAGAR
jgi:hypothetical protein